MMIQSIGNNLFMIPVHNLYITSTIQFVERNTSFEEFILSKNSNNPNDT